MLSIYTINSKQRKNNNRAELFKKLEKQTVGEGLQRHTNNLLFGLNLIGIIYEFEVNY